MKALGLYLHIPFCRSKCAYCDFYSKGQDKDIQSSMDEYQTALLTQIQKEAPKTIGYEVATVYIGGGTPSFYGGTRIATLLAHIHNHFTLSPHVEITVEGNPESITPHDIALWKEQGVNRVSMGMQSAILEELQAIGRPHSPEDCHKALSHLREAGITNLSLDFIYGLPKQTMASWQYTLEEAISLSPTHLSCYGLKVEEGTPLFQRVAQGELLPDEDLQSDMYLWTVQRLEEAGYHQYEISNFAKTGYHSRHNLSYWTGVPYLGLGASASSDFQGSRYTALSDMEDYRKRILKGQPVYDTSDAMSPYHRLEEAFFLGLRCTDGISLRDLEERFASSCPFDSRNFLPLLQRFQEEEWAIYEKERWKFTPKGFLKSNLLLTALLEILENASEH